MDERDVLALLHAGGRDLRTVRLVVTTRSDHDVGRKAIERWHREGGESLRIYGPGPARERPRFAEVRTRLWIERPDKAREETEGEFPRYGVRVGDTWWLWHEGNGAVTNNGSPNHHAGVGDDCELLIEPAPLLPHFDFEVIGEDEQAGRPGVRVRARKRAARDRDGFMAGLPVGYDELELLVDRERGTLLQLAALFDGEPGVDRRIEEIAYDEPIPPGTFEFVPPPGEEIEDVSRRERIHDLPIEQVAERASFTVFVATRLDGAWRMRAMHLPPRRGRPHEHVHLHYHRDDATHSFGINEQRADAEPLLTAVREPEEILRGGERLQVIRPTDEFPLGSVRLTRDGTSIELTSDNLPLERLLELVDGLRPAQ